jgi:hypothetical protein
LVNILNILIKLKIELDNILTNLVRDNNIVTDTFNTPVALFIFNRPDCALKVFNQIKLIKPSHFLIISDGPRLSRPEEITLCTLSKKIVELIDWPCKIETNFSDINLGCKKRISTGLNWVFSLVDAAIILEDDCLPDITFFRYCEELLQIYKNDHSVGTISGTNLAGKSEALIDSYYFSLYPRIWGWATWRRAWKNYDVEMRSWPEFCDNKNIEKILTSGREEIVFWKDVLNKTFNNKIDTWDFQWTFACWKNDMKTIIPNVNLISNIGFDSRATHTKRDSEFSSLSLNAMNFPLKHPYSKNINQSLDLSIVKKMHISKLRRIFNYFMYKCKVYSYKFKL